MFKLSALKQSASQSVRSFSSTASRNSFAKMSIMGNIQQLERKESKSGKVYVTYQIPVQYKRDSPTSWYKIACFDPNQIAFLTNYGKGARVYVDCDAKYEVYTKSDGSTSVSLNLVQKNFNLINSAKSQSEADVEHEEVEAEEAEPTH